MKVIIRREYTVEGIYPPTNKGFMSKGSEYTIFNAANLEGGITEHGFNMVIENNEEILAVYSIDFDFVDEEGGLKK